MPLAKALIFPRSLVPPQQPDDIRAKVEKYLNEEFAKLNTKCTMKIEYLHGGIPWVADYNHWNYQAAKTATEVSLGFALFPPRRFSLGSCTSMHSVSLSLGSAFFSEPIVLTIQ